MTYLLIGFLGPLRPLINCPERFKEIEKPI